MITNKPVLHISHFEMCLFTACFLPISCFFLPIPAYSCQFLPISAIFLPIPAVFTYFLPIPAVFTYFLPISAVFKLFPAYSCLFESELQSCLLKSSQTVNKPVSILSVKCLLFIPGSTGSWPTGYTSHSPTHTRTLSYSYWHTNTRTQTLTHWHWDTDTDALTLTHWHGLLPAVLEHDDVEDGLQHLLEDLRPHLGGGLG